MNLVPKPVRSFLRLDREQGEAHDFLGLVYFDPARNVLVLPEHVAAILSVAGTDWAYRLTQREDIISGWANLLNGSGLSVQVFYHRRPIKWDEAGGHLDIIERQVNESTPDPDSWEHRRFARYKEAMLSGEDKALRGINEVYQYVVIRFAMGATESVRQAGESAMYLPPKTGWRFWEQAATLFGGPEGRSAWESKANAAAHKLNEEIRVFTARAENIPDFYVERATPLETIQLLHLLWIEDNAYNPGLWVRDGKMMNQIVSGEVENSGSGSGITVDTSFMEPEEDPQ